MQIKEIIVHIELKTELMGIASANRKTLTVTLCNELAMLIKESFSLQLMKRVSERPDRLSMNPADADGGSGLCVRRVRIRAVTCGGQREGQRPLKIIFPPHDKSLNPLKIGVLFVVLAD